MFEPDSFRPRPGGGGVKAMLRANPVMWSVLAINVVYFLVLEAAGGSESVEVLIDYGAKYGPGIADGEYWRLILPVFMHIGAFHLIANSIGLLVFGGIVERSYGWRAFLAIYLTAGVAGNVASYAAGPTVGAGASGAIFGMLGAFAVYLYFNRTLLGSSARGSLGGLAFIIAINIGFGLTTTGVDNWAHFGGLVAGGLLALRLSPRVVTENTYGLNNRLLLARPVVRQPAGAVIATATAAAFAVIVLITVIVGRDDAGRNRDLSSDLTGRAIESLLLQRFEEASSQARQALLSNPPPEFLGVLYVIKGLGEAQQGDFDAAIRDLNRALTYDLDADTRKLAESELTRLTGR
ncbi:MAG: rhomboid family intramembrane serine protease [Chloroflexi bacterium]|nr:rhomboid family intramembrane serine protease [Chloroflexota bacterium]